MNRRKLTPEEMAAKVAKMKATKAAKKAAALAQVGYVATTKKIRKKRVLTEEQKQAARDRLAKARAAKKNSGEAPRNVHPSVLNLPDDNVLSYKNVREWIKYSKEIRTEEKRAARANVKGAEGRVASIDGYIRNMDHYIRTGDWVDSYYGQDQGNKVKWKSIAPAYHFQGPYKGMMKRDVGVRYSDVGVWTQEMHDDYYDKPITKKRKAR